MDSVSKLNFHLIISSSFSFYPPFLLFSFLFFVEMVSLSFTLWSHQIFVYVTIYLMLYTLDDMESWDGLSTPPIC